MIKALISNELMSRQVQPISKDEGMKLAGIIRLKLRRPHRGFVFLDQQVA